VTIDPAFDRVVHSAPGWTGLQFSTAAERERGEARHGAAFATAIDADQVVVIGIDVVRSQRVVSGALLNKHSGTELRRAIIPIEASPSAEQLRGLARFLVSGGPLPPGVIAPPPGRGRDGGDGGGGGSGPWGGWKYITGGAAVAAGVTGGILLAYDGKCSVTVDEDVPCPTPYDNTAQGWLAVGGAVALAGVTVYLVVKERRARGTRGTGGEGARSAAYVAPTAGGAVAGIAGRF